jgi:fatty-acyl-CoA synthase
VPREIVFVEDLPRTALGKVQHFMLKQIDANTPGRGDVA